MNAAISLLVGGLILFLTGCATPNQKYDWGKYDSSLYSYYKDPSKANELSASLEAVINNSKGAKVPPGIYAEYGYLQLQQGKNQEAVDSFKQEAAHWPESKVFMDQMIKVASASSTHGSSQ